MKRTLNVGLKLVVSVGLLYYLLSRADLEGFTEVLSHTAPWLFVCAVLFFVLSNALGTAQWFLLLRAQQLEISFRQALVCYWVGVFFNNVLLGNVGGDAVRIYDVRRLTGEGTGGAAATFLDRFIGLFSVCCLAMAAYVVVAEVRAAGLVHVVFPVWLGLIVFLTMGLSRRVGALGERLIQPIVPRSVAELVSRLRQSLGVYRSRPGLLIRVWSVSLGVQLCRILVYWCAGLAVGMQLDLRYFVGFQPVAAIIAALPISIGGLGVRENVLVELFAGVGAGESVAFAMSLLGYASGIVASLLGGVAFIVRRVERAKGCALLAADHQVTGKEVTGED